MGDRIYLLDACASEIDFNTITMIGVDQESKTDGNYRINGFSDFVHRRHFKELEDIKNTTFWDGETPTLLGPLQRANLNHWTNHVKNTKLYKHLRPG
jgi:hypothetical protein